MKTCLKSILLAILFIAITSSSFAQTDDDALQRFINNQDYFGLNKELKKPNLDASEHTLLMAKAYAGYYFNRPQEAIESIEKLMKDHADKMRGGYSFNLVFLQAESYGMAGQYAKAAETYETIIERIKQWVDPETSGHNAFLRRYLALSKFQPQKMVLNSTATIPAKTDKMGLITVPVTMGNKTLDFIFSTGSGYCAISEDNAKQMGIKDTGIEMDGFDDSNNLQVKMKLGVAEKMKIGNVEFENILFLIKPGKLTEKDAPDYAINGMIGLNAMLIMGEIEYDKSNNMITVLDKPKKYDSANLMFNNSRLFAQGISGDNTLLMDFDTRALKTYMTSRFHHRYGLDYEKTAAHGTMKLGRLGLSSETVPVRIVKDFSLQIGDAKKVLPEMNIQTETIDKVYHVDGILGLDYINLYNKMIINYNDMYITFK